MMADPIYCNLSTTQIDAMEKLRNIMSDELSEFESYNKNFVLYRFLKARRWDVNKAEFMLKKSVQWRRQNNLKDYQPPEFLQKYLNNMHIGTDKEGCPIIFTYLGRSDVKGFLNSAKPVDVIKFMVQFCLKQELLIEEKCAEVKRWISGGVVIYDCDGLNLKLTEADANRKGVELFIRLARVVQDNFPERLKAIFLINAPAILSIPIRIVKNFLATETQRKVNISSTGFQEKLLEIIDAEKLPAFLGGTRTDPDGNPYCRTLVNQMGPVDESYYLDRNSENSLANVPGVSTVLVPRSSTTKIHIYVENEGSVIEWEFQVIAGDIGFSLFYKKTHDDVTPVVVLDKVDAKDYIETGEYICEKSGKYYAEFDNSYSWLKSKEIFYVFKIHRNGLEM